MATSKKQQIESDCSLLLIRSLYKHWVNAFGEDGGGKYGRNPFPKTFFIEDVDVDISITSSSYSSAPPTYEGQVFLKIKDYSSKDCGHILSDHNFMLSIQQLLKDESIDPHCMTWGKLKEQGEDFVVMNFDVSTLLSWE